MTAVKALLAQYGSVAMVGDGNSGHCDGAGTAQAMEAADIALVGNDLSKLPFALKLVQAAMQLCWPMWVPVCW